MAQEHQAEIHKKLWSIANTLRANSSMEPFEFKNYILSIIFYKFLSEKVEDTVVSLLEEENKTYVEAWADIESQELLKEELLSDVGYIIEPQYLFSNIVKEIPKGDNGSFGTELLGQAVNSLITSTRGHDSEDDFDSLFDDMDLTSTRLGKDVKSRSQFMAKIVSAVDSISFHHDDVEIDVLGDAYEYMISNFAAGAGKKAGEFYTPQQVSKLLAKIVVGDKDSIKSVYDPTCGSGSLLLRVAKELTDDRGLHYYGQELTSTTYNLARMNMMLHGVPYDKFEIRNGNTLTEPMHEGKKFEAIVANPPYSANWNPTSETLKDDRFSGYGKLAPSSKADFAFVQHMIHHLDDDGTMAVVLPHGVLFRGAAEGVIRKKLIENNYLDAVIGLPANIFFGTSIPTCVLVFKKNREENADVLFIDASQEFEKGKNQNSLTDTHLEKIIATYTLKRAETSFSILIGLDSIKENNFNLNITRYVTSKITEIKIDIEKTFEEINRLDVEINFLDSKIEGFLEELTPGFDLEWLNDEKVFSIFDKEFGPSKELIDIPIGAIVVRYNPKADIYGRSKWVFWVSRENDRNYSENKTWILGKTSLDNEKTLLKTIRRIVKDKTKLVLNNTKVQRFEDVLLLPTHEAWGLKI